MIDLKGDRVQRLQLLPCDVDVSDLLDVTAEARRLPFLVREVQARLAPFELEQERQQLEQAAKAAQPMEQPMEIAGDSMASENSGQSEAAEEEEEDGEVVVARVQSPSIVSRILAHSE